MYVHDQWLDDESFAKLVADYKEETRAWKRLRVGQILYECDGYDCFEHEIVEIDVPGRIVITRDLSLENKPRKVHPHMGGLSLEPLPCM